MSNLTEHAKHEMKHWIESDDEMSNLMAKQILEIVELFASHGHSGFSASMAANIIDRLIRFKPLGPLTGEDGEWNQVSDDTLQNKRCSSVFKDLKTGIAYTINGNVFRDQNGNTYTTYLSNKVITFPYEPVDPTVVDVYDPEVNQEN